MRTSNGFAANRLCQPRLLKCATHTPQRHSAMCPSPVVTRCAPYIVRTHSYIICILNTKVTHIHRDNIDVTKRRWKCSYEKIRRNRCRFGFRDRVPDPLLILNGLRYPLNRLNYLRRALK